MTWARFDDRYDDHEKVKRAWKVSPAAAALHAHAITYSSRHETDGVVTADWIQERFDIARLKPKERTAAMDALVAGGLLESIDGESFRVHDYLDYNPSRAELDEKRRKDAERKARGRTNRGHPDSDRTPEGFHEDSGRTPNGWPLDSAGSPPVPSLPGPSRPEGPRD